ncbi:MAG TPA: gluconate 2-dehydrogenase subunit 3 family protein [Stellaceae bacterium]|nr:gluconate 2-dehydrogenase subunit 3 family protein [Stellaceae bacterium]
MSERFQSRFPSYDVLDKRHSPSWNEQTRAVIDRRLHQIPERQFFTEREWAILHAVCARLIPQPDRPQNAVPIVPFIDERLHRNIGSGYRYEEMPPQRKAWRQGIAAIDDEAHLRWRSGFCGLPANQQDATLRAIQHGDVRSPEWAGLPARRFFKSVLLREAVSVYYAHPAAWSEIGFGGPAAPRGYVRLASDRRDPWEAEERYER